MFKVVYKDLCNFLKNHFLASIIITIAYFVFTKMLIENAFNNPNPLLGYQFFYSNNFIVNIFLFAVIISTTFLIMLYFEHHRKVDTNLFFSALKDKLPKFVFGGLFASFILGIICYLGFLFAKLDSNMPNNLIGTVKVSIFIIGLMLMFKSMTLFFPMLYYENDKSVSQVYRSCIKRTSWRLIAYYLFIAIILNVLGFVVYYIFDILSLFKFMGIGIEHVVQAYVHVLMMLVAISLYKNITKP